MEVTEVETFVVDADWRNWFFVQVKTDGASPVSGKRSAARG